MESNYLIATKANYIIMLEVCGRYIPCEKISIKLNQFNNTSRVNTANFWHITAYAHKRY